MLLAGASAGLAGGAICALLLYGAAFERAWHSRSHQAPIVPAPT